MCNLVARTELGDAITVSTVSLVVANEPPSLLFETRVFGGPLDDQYEHYATREEAEVGHRRWVEKVRFAHLVKKTVEDSKEILEELEDK